MARTVSIRRHTPVSIQATKRILEFSKQTGSTRLLLIIAADIENDYTAVRNAKKNPSRYEQMSSSSILKSSKLRKLAKQEDHTLAAQLRHLIREAVERQPQQNQKPVWAARTRCSSSRPRGPTAAP